MICKSCREVVHEKCDGVLRHPSYCDCQHRGFIMAVERIDKAMLAASQAWFDTASRWRATRR